MKTEIIETSITFGDAVNAWGPIVDAQRMVKKLLDLMGHDCDFLAELEEKLYRAETPIKACLDRMEKDNPEKFGGES